MNVPRKYLHNRLILGLLTILAVLLVIGVASVFLRFDASKNPTTISTYRPNVSGSGLVSGKAIDIYELAIFMIGITAANIVLSIKVFNVRHYLSVFILASTALLLVISIIVTNSLISLQ